MSSAKVFANLLIAIALVAVTAISTFSSGCSSGTEKSNVSSKSKTSLFETKWLIRTLNGSRVLIPEGGKEVFITFKSDGGSSGISGCNNFSGKATISGSAMTFGPIAGTRMMCPSQMDTERDFLAMLGKSATFKISGNTLSIMDEAKSVIATFDGFKSSGILGE